MPRNPHPGVSTHRNRNRINNKTRLKIHQGNIDSDALLIPDEDEEKHRLSNLVAGVDAEDANEHHLQIVLSASQRTAPTQRSTKAGEKSTATSVYIPTPDSTGTVDNYEELYRSKRWKDPITYLCSSSTNEESILYGLTGGFTYFMDERDKEWLDKNNEEARGEGTSTQGAISTGTRTSSRSAKAKGKEPDVSQPIVISEDEFELVMGLFEKITHEKTEFLHHSLQTGMAFPGFSDYQDVFSAPLPAATFASYTMPSWLPPPPALLRIAKVIHPYWKERRIEREGHRIIPVLNGDETDTLNESYICFRRREIKAVRKTRASQVTSSDKLARLQAEMNYPLELARSILSRETLKKECQQQAQKMPPPGTIPQMRISSNGGMRPPAIPTGQASTPVPANAAPVHTPPPQPIIVPRASPVNGSVNSRPAIAMPHVDAMKVDPTPLSTIPNGVVAMQPVQQSEVPAQTQETTIPNAGSPVRPKAQPQQVQSITLNGYHPPVNGFPASTFANAVQFSQHANGLSAQQFQTLRSAFQNANPGQQDPAALARANVPNPSAFMHVPSGANFNLQLGTGASMKLSGPPMQWNVGSAMQRPPSANNGMEGVSLINGINGALPAAPTSVPVRTPSANGTRPPIRATNMLGVNGQIAQHVMSPRLQHTPSPMPIPQSQSPPRLPMTPTLSIASPSLPQQQPVGSSQNGY